MSTSSGSATLKGTGSPRISPAKLMKPLTDKGSQPGPAKSGRTSIEAHGDGTYHSESGYGMDRVEHPTFGHLVAHLALKHSAGEHLHVMKNSPMVSHGVKDGKMHGPHDHKNLEALKKEITKFFTEEEAEKD